ncbi:uncharacterized protein LOC112568273 isoform X3 [Pomacea canaliculata]|uniref:uncharacterized protein LOC112568273 isoform X3 n=1 Tax=Pomacea canaliculata TaxID=400727 RepID=UPI000D73E70B|nr:uncharacterized protein LOC112568273 isoform X3 [Pomacea canaliculata]
MRNFSNYFQLLLLTTVVLEVVSESQIPESKTTCGIRYWEARDMMLTCYFHEDISATPKRFAVYLYPGAKMVIACDWFDELHCEVDPAYKYDKVIYRDHINIRIPDAAEKHVGTYACQVNGEKNHGNCSFTASQIPPNLPAPSSYLEPTTKTVPTFASTTAATSALPDDQQTQSTSEQSSAEPWRPAAELIHIVTASNTGQDTACTQKDNIVIAVSVPVAASALVIILIVILYHHCRRHQKQSRKRENEENDDTDREQRHGLLTHDKEWTCPRTPLSSTPETTTDR